MLARVPAYFMLLLFLLPLNSRAAADESDGDRKTVTVIAGAANLRERPALSSARISSIARGEVLEVLDESADRSGKTWYRVRTSGGKTGWIKDIAVALAPLSPDAESKEKNKDIEAIEKDLAAAWTQYDRGDYESMEKSAHSALDAAKRAGYKRGIFGGDYCLAISYISREKYDGAVDYALHAQDLAMEGRDEVRLGMVYNLMGNIFRQKEVYEKALYFYGKYLEIAKRRGSREGEAAARNNIGNVMMEKGRYKEALAYYKDSLSASSVAGTDKHLIAQGYLSVGRAFKKLEDYRSAGKNFTSAVEMFKQEGNEGGVFIGIWEEAVNRGLLGEYDAAIKILEENLSRAEEFGLKQNFLDELITCSEKSKDSMRLEKYRKMKAG
jgi:tetratricopeptide (TPR) repeat protein